MDDGHASKVENGVRFSMPAPIALCVEPSEQRRLPNKQAYTGFVKVL